MPAATGYYLRTSALDAELGRPTACGPRPGTAGGQSAAASPLGDLSTFRTITQDSLDLLVAGDQSGATTRIGDLEYEWDDAQARLKPRDGTAWTEVDDKIDTVLRDLRSTSPQPDQEQAALTALLVVLG